MKLEHTIVINTKEKRPIKKTNKCPQCELEELKKIIKEKDKSNK
jgi:hypothetical protein